MQTWLSNHVKADSFSEFTVTRQACGRYYINLPMKSRNCKPAVDSRKAMAALDPGKRTFIAYYSDVECGKIGSDMCQSIEPHFTKLDKLQSAIVDTTKCSKTRRSLKQRSSVLRTKIQNKITDLHWQTASWLTKNFKSILIPIFNSQQMMQSLGKETNRYLQCLSHYTFRQRLIQKGKLNNCKIIVCLEPFTSKTCGNCGNIKWDLKNAEIYLCNKCGMKMDRDVNGARNILLRSLTKMK